MPPPSPIHPGSIRGSVAGARGAAAMQPDDLQDAGATNWVESMAYTVSAGMIALAGIIIAGKLIKQRRSSLQDPIPWERGGRTVSPKKRKGKKGDRKANYAALDEEDEALVDNADGPAWEDEESAANMPDASSNSEEEEEEEEEEADSDERDDEEADRDLPVSVVSINQPAAEPWGGRRTRRSSSSREDEPARTPPRAAAAAPPPIPPPPPPPPPAPAQPILPGEETEEERAARKQAYHERGMDID